MRLIDLDQTIFVPIVDETQNGVEYEMEMTIGEMFDRFLGGFQPEIVDAVPVGWLCQKVHEEGERKNFLHAEYIKYLIWEWHQEDNADEF